MRHRLNSGLSQHLSKRLRAFDKKIALGDVVLYRDEKYFQELKLYSAQSTITAPLAIESISEVNITPEESPTTPKKASIMTAPIDEKGDSGPLVPCQVCSRNFASDRIAKHLEVCEKTTAKPRTVYDVVKARVAGTEAEGLIASGRLKLEPAKPMEKKSDLMKKYNVDNAKIEEKPKEDKAKDKSQKVAQKKNGEAYQVVFDDSDKMRTRKPTAAIAPSKLPATVVRQGTHKQDLRYLSAKNWKKQRQQVSPDLNSSFSEDDIDFLASSMTSQKTVCSDAFDFLFDEKNLNPEQVLEREFNRSPSHIGVGQGKDKEACCVIS